MIFVSVKDVFFNGQSSTARLCYILCVALLSKEGGTILMMWVLSYASRVRILYLSHLGYVEDTHALENALVGLRRGLGSSVNEQLRQSDDILLWIYTWRVGVNELALSRDQWVFNGLLLCRVYNSNSVELRLAEFLGVGSNTLVENRRKWIREEPRSGIGCGGSEFAGVH